MTDWLFHCLVLTTHKGVPNLFFHFKSSSKMTIIMLLRTFKFLVCLVYVWIYIHVISGWRHSKLYRATRRRFEKRKSKRR